MTLSEFARVTWSRIRRNFGVRYFLPQSPTVDRSDEYEESLTVALGSELSTAAESFGGSERRKQRNSKKRVSEMLDALSVADAVYRRAWKFSRFDAELSDWPATNIDLMADRTFKYDDVVIDLTKWRPAAKVGFDISMMLRARTENGWRPNTFLLTRMRTFKQESSTARMRDFLRRFEMFVDLSAVVVELGGRRPYISHGSFALGVDGRLARFKTTGHSADRTYVTIAKKDEQAERELREIAQVFAAYHFGRSFLWDLQMLRGPSRLRIAIDRVGARELAHMRDSGGARRRALLHWVDGRNGAYLRGETDFSWSGFRCSVVPSNHDRQMLDAGELPIGSLTDYLKNAEVAA